MQWKRTCKKGIPPHLGRSPRHAFFCARAWALGHREAGDGCNSQPSPAQGPFDYLSFNCFFINIYKNAMEKNMQKGNAPPSGSVPGARIFLCTGMGPWAKGGQ